MERDADAASDADPETETDAGRIRASDGRMRPWLRIAAVTVAFVVATSLATIPAMLFDSLAVQHAAAGIAMLLVAVGLFTLVARRVDRRRVVSYGLATDMRWWLDLTVGAVLGVLVGLVAFLWLLATGYAQVADVLDAGTQEGLWTGLVAAAIYFVAVAVWEELVFRGYVMSNGAEALARSRPPASAVIGAWLLSIPIFAVGHANQFLASEAPVALALAFFVLTGALLGLAYACTGQLGLPIGIHLTVNLGMNRIFPLVPPDDAAPVAVAYRLSLDGPGWLVGVGGMAHIVGVGAALAGLWAWLRIRPGPIAVDESIAVRSDDEWIAAS